MINRKSALWDELKDVFRDVLLLIGSAWFPGDRMLLLDEAQCEQAVQAWRRGRPAVAWLNPVIYSHGEEGRRERRGATTTTTTTTTTTGREHIARQIASGRPPPSSCSLWETHTSQTSARQLIAYLFDFIHCSLCCAHTLVLLLGLGFFFLPRSLNTSSSSSQCGQQVFIPKMFFFFFLRWWLQRAEVVEGGGSSHSSWVRAVWWSRLNWLKILKRLTQTLGQHVSIDQARQWWGSKGRPEECKTFRQAEEEEGRVRLCRLRNKLFRKKLARVKSAERKYYLKVDKKFDFLGFSLIFQRCFYVYSTRAVHCDLIPKENGSALGPGRWSYSLSPNEN